jgi:hypothetical protein
MTEGRQPEVRQAFKRTPIEIDLGGEVISVGPVPWEQRNDFGNEVIRQHLEILNEGVKIYLDPETSAPQLEAKLNEKFTDPGVLLRLGLEEKVYEQIKSRPMFQNQVVVILLAIAEVNELQQLYPLLDPNLEAPTTLSGLLWQIVEEARSGEDTQKTESGPDSSSQDSAEQSSEPSPIPSSVSS